MYTTYFLLIYSFTQLTLSNDMAIIQNIDLQLKQNKIELEIKNNNLLQKLSTVVQNQFLQFQNISKYDCNKRTNLLCGNKNNKFINKLNLAL